MDTKKKEKQSSFILPGLLTILTAIAVVYCLLQYRDSLLIIGISTLLLLAASYWLFLSIVRFTKNREASAPSVGEQQRERMNYEGMKLQGEELIRLVNMLGKGTYVNTKRTAEQVTLLSEQYEQLIKTNERLIQKLIDEETKLAKFQVKYAQNDTGKLVSSINRISDTPVTTQASLPAADLHEIASSIDSLSTDLADINASIQELRLAINDIHIPEAPSASDMPMADSIPDISEVEAPTDNINAPGISEAAASEPAPESSPIISDDPNKQLSADEIAALFASLG